MQCTGLSEAQAGLYGKDITVKKLTSIVTLFLLSIFISGCSVVYSDIKQAYVDAKVIYKDAKYVVYEVTEEVEELKEGKK